MSIKTLLCGLLFLLASSEPGTILAGTWFVDDAVNRSGSGTSWEAAFRTIQEGIDRASDGDTVIVAQGVYAENVHFQGKNVILRSTDPLGPGGVASTIIDPNQKGGSAVTFEGSETEACVLSGFTIRNALSWGRAGGVRGGIWHRPTHATIRNNVITGNIAEQEGGGIAYCDGIIEGNVISDNKACLGGGLCGCNGIIRNNVITGNVAFGPLVNIEYLDPLPPDEPYPPPELLAMGGGLYGCHGTIEGNVISRNRLGGSSRGAGLCACGGTIRNNVIIGNAATWGYGGGMAFCGGVIRNNTIITNWAVGGAGLYCCGGAIQNCIVWGNLADEGAQLYESSQPTYSCIQDWTPGGSNISSDPCLIVRPRRDDNSTPGWTYDDVLIEGDYHLRPDSACIDAGDNSVLQPPGLDFDGNLRIAFGRTSLTVDIGAYEYNSAQLAVREVFQDQWGVHLIWNSQPNDTYLIWSCTDPSGRRCVLEATVPSQGALTWWTDRETASPREFYRIEMK